MYSGQDYPYRYFLCLYFIFQFHYFYTCFATCTKVMKCKNMYKSNEIER